jgi:hypothetical protein
MWLSTGLRRHQLGAAAENLAAARLQISKDAQNKTIVGKFRFPAGAAALARVMRTA